MTNFTNLVSIVKIYLVKLGASLEGWINKLNGSSKYKPKAQVKENECQVSTTYKESMNFGYYISKRVII